MNKLKPRFLPSYHLIMFPLILIFITVASGCQTLNSSDRKNEKKNEILNTQKALIISFLNKGLSGMALKELRNLLSQYPDDADFRNLMGLTHLALKNPKEALKYFNSAYKIKHCTSIALNLSSAYIELGQYKKAIDFLLNLMLQDETKNYLHQERIAHNMALASEKRGLYKKAKKYYLKALSHNPNFYISTMRLGQLYEKTGHPVKAKKRYLKAKKLCELCFDPINALTMSYFTTGHINRAIVTIKTYLKRKDILPNNRNRAVNLLKMAKKIKITTNESKKRASKTP